mgnify:CR=1 FL=1
MTPRRAGFRELGFETAGPGVDYRFTVNHHVPTFFFTLVNRWLTVAMMVLIRPLRPAPPGSLG